MWVKAKVDPKLYLHIPGTIIRVWGHDFEIQTDGSLCTDMHEDFVATEIKAGRIKKISPPPGKGKPEIKVTKLEPATGFTMDIGNYYGAGDLDTLFERVTKMKRGEIVQFSKERFPKEKRLKGNIAKEDLIDQIRTYIDSALMEGD